MSETPGTEKETSPYHNDTSVKSEEQQKLDVASPPLAGGIDESKDIESEATPMDTDNGQAAQGEHCLNSVKQINSNSTPSIVDINTLTPSTPSQTPPQLLAAETSSTTATTASSAPSTVVATAAAIPDNILSPPKSETQTDETNTATSTSCSPASEGQRSPLGEAEQQPPPQEEPKTPKQELEPEPEPSKAVNGIIPKSGGKPLVTALNKKINKSASTSPRASRARKPKALPMYESEISDNKVGIKLCIKKSDAVPAAAELPIGTTSASPVAPTTRTGAAPSKSARKRVRKPKPPQDSDESEYEPRKKKGGGTGSAGGGSGSSNNGERQKKISTSGTAETETEPVEQSAWGQKLPEEVLFRVRLKLI